MPSFRRGSKDRTLPVRFGSVRAALMVIGLLHGDALRLPLRRLRDPEASASLAMTPYRPISYVRSQNRCGRRNQGARMALARAAARERLRAPRKLKRWRYCAADDGSSGGCRRSLHDRWSELRSPRLHQIFVGGHAVAFLMDAAPSWRIAPPRRSSLHRWKPRPSCAAATRDRFVNDLQAPWCISCALSPRILGAE